MTKLDELISGCEEAKRDLSLAAVRINDLIRRCDEIAEENEDMGFPENKTVSGAAAVLEVIGHSLNDCFNFTKDVQAGLNSSRGGDG